MSLSFNITKWMPAIFQTIEFAQQLFGKGKGSDKLQYVIDHLPEEIAAIEAGSGDVINDQAVQQALIEFVSAAKSLENAVRAAKDIKNK